MPQLQQHDLHELEILRHVENSPNLTNRTAAGKLGVSVKLAHEILKRMVQKGLLHVHKENSRSWQYILTPQGISEKARLTMEFLEFSMHFYREARRQSASVCRDLSRQEQQHVAFLGSGELAEIVYLGVQEWHLELTEVFDDERQGTDFMGVAVSGFDAIPSCAASAIVVCCYDAQFPLKQYLPPGVATSDKMRWIFD